jgi:two-component system, NarL family, invasion response regulator UvrY
MSSPPIRIIIADDHKLIRESWRVLLENNSRFKVIAACKNGEEAVAQARVLLPDILLVDINMSPGNGFEVTRRILKELPAVKVIGMSVNNQPKYAIRMIELGARGYLTKTSSWEEINEGINQVYEGGIYICEEIRKYMLPGEL